MLKHNLQFALRFLINYRFYNSINLFGLVLGLTITIFLYLIIYQELNYDRFYTDYKKIYQIFQYEKKANGTFINGAVSVKTAAKLSNEIPEFEIVSLIPLTRAPQLKINDVNLNENGLYADSNFFRLFTFELVKGRKEQVFSLKENIIISEEISVKYFPGLDPIGKDIFIQSNSNRVFKVAGVIKNNPTKSSLQFDYLIPIQNFYSDFSSDFTGKEENILRVYTKISSKNSVVSASEKILPLAREKEMNNNAELFLFPFYKSHVKPVTFKDASGGGMTGAIIALSIFGFLILFIACINYANLATALSIKRNKETGIRKIMGSSTFNISLQFLLEAFLLSSLAMVLALVSVFLITPWFNATFNWNLDINYLDPVLITGLIVILLLATFMSGSYPAFYMSQLNPLLILKGSNAKGRKSSSLRKGLVIIQFFFATIFIIISISSLKQINYIINKELGVNINDLVLIDLSGNLNTKKESLRNEISKLSAVEKSSFTSGNPLLILDETTEIDYEGKGSDQIKPVAIFSSDYDFVSTMGLTLVTGRNYDKELLTDSVNFLINETASNGMEQALKVGTRISVSGKMGSIIGIFKDYHMTHINFPIKPMIIACNSQTYTTLLIKLKNKTGSDGISQIKNIIKNFANDNQPALITMKEAFNNIYKDNVFKTGKLSVILSLLALGIACMGLISLSMFTSESRTKEAGIHLVMGASRIRIIRLLILEYVYCISISFALACPLGYIIIYKLFSRTAYHTDISFSVFLLAIFIVSALALSTIIIQAYRIATRNPSETLKYE